MFFLFNGFAANGIARNIEPLSYFLGTIILILLIASITINKAKKEAKKTKDKYKSLFDHMEEGFALHEIIVNEEGLPVDYRFLEINSSFEKITGLKDDEIKNKTVREILPGIEEYWIEKYGEVALQGTSMSFSNYSGELGKHFNVNVYSPSPGNFATIFTDVTFEKKAQEKIEEDRNLFKTTIDSIGDGVISTDLDGNIIIMNQVAEKLTGWTNSEAKGKPFRSIFNILEEPNNLSSENPLYRVIEKNTVLINKNKEKIIIEESAAPIKDEQGKIKGVVVIFRDYTDKKEKLEKIEYLSYHDQLTGLYNRHFFEDQIRRVNTERNLPLTIGMIDVNGLKMVNDVFGHESGDKLLKRIAQVLKDEFRADDIISRFGGDEFVILLPKTGYTETEVIMNRIQLALENQNHDDFVYSISIGWATKVNPQEDIKEILSIAEDSMYKKKILESQNMRIQTIDLILERFHKEVPIEKVHSEKVSDLCRKIGEKMKLDVDSLQELEVAAHMHDIGKIIVDKKILNKSDKLSETEFEQIKKHTEIGYRIVKSVDRYANLAEFILSHHERWDGSGYTRGLSSEKIPLLARIISIAEAYESMRGERPYQRTYTHEEAIEEIRRNSGTQFDPEIVKIFEQCFSP